MYAIKAHTICFVIWKYRCSIYLKMLCLYLLTGFVHLTSHTCDVWFMILPYCAPNLQQTNDANSDVYVAGKTINQRCIVMIFSCVWAMWCLHVIVDKIWFLVLYIRILINMFFIIQIQVYSKWAFSKLASALIIVHCQCKYLSYSCLMSES